MKTITTATKNFSNKDKFNINAGAHALAEAVSQQLKVTAACVGEDVDSAGKPVIAAAIITESGAFTTISGTATAQITDLIPFLDDEGTVEILVDKRLSKGGRDYLVLTLV